MSTITVSLTPEELDIIAGWYDASAGESAHERDAALFSLLEKLGIHANGRDVYLADPMHTCEEHRHEVYASNDAIKSYRLRHPDYEEVLDAIAGETE